VRNKPVLAAAGDGLGWFSVIDYVCEAASFPIIAPQSILKIGAPPENPEKGSGFAFLGRLRLGPHMKSFNLAFLSLTLALTAQADEGMWIFNQTTRRILRER